jgi:hypothetical protein
VSDVDWEAPHHRRAGGGRPDECDEFCRPNCSGHGGNEYDDVRDDEFDASLPDTQRGDK